MPAFPAIRGELKKAPLQKYPFLAMLDKGVAWALMCGMFAFELSCLVMAFVGFIDGASPVETMLATGAISSFVIAVMGVILWHSFCYYDSRVRSLMMWKTRLTPTGFMRIGFVPIPAAASVGLLMLVTGSFVSPSIQAGSFLTIAGTSVPGHNALFLPWLPEMACTAAGIEEPDFLTRWGARFDRTSPSTLKARFQQRWYDLLTLFNLRQGSAIIDAEGSCFRTLHEFGKDDVINADGTDKVIPNLVHPLGEDKRLCMYLCGTWQNVNFQTVITKVGSISVGAAIVVTMTEYVTSQFGLPTVTGDLSAGELENLFHQVGPQIMWRKVLNEFQTSMTICALPILVFGFLSKFVLASKLDGDGYNTQDYFVTYALLYSIILVMIVRRWNPFEQRPQLFTQKIWGEGADLFIVSKDTKEKWDRVYGRGQIESVRDVGDHSVLVTIDLYQWMHLRGKERSLLLINCCRLPGKGATTDGDKVVTLSDTVVQVKHELDYNDEKINAKKSITLPKGTEMTLDGWKNDAEAKCTAVIDGKKEKLVMSRFEILETSDVWEQLTAKYEALLKEEEDNEASEEESQQE